MTFLILSLFLFPLFLRADVLTVPTSAPENRLLKIHYRLPASWNRESRIMVLFGGRNWPGNRTLSEYHFDQLADQYNLILVSPSFVNDTYWEPEKWSGRALFSAIGTLEKKFHLKRKKMLYYGFSAGGQCANLFYAYAPERVFALGIHACGVYFNARGWKKPLVPILLTCGSEDPERFLISKTFLCQYRESGGTLLWIPDHMGHQLNRFHLEIATCFFQNILENSSPLWIGEDDTKLYYPICEKEKIDPEFRNPLYDKKLLKFWEQTK